MISNIITFIVLLGLSYWIAGALAAKHNRQYQSVFINLIWYHAILAIVYYLYAINNPSDSWEYQRRILIGYRGEGWLDFYGLSTRFIEFLGYPLIKYLQMPFESVMMVFSWFGLLGFFYFYVAIKERVRFKHTFLGMDLVLLIFFLPNLHFWAASFGKGSIIFLGLGLFFYGLTKVNKRFLALILGSLIIYHVRPHILFIILIGTLIGFTFSTKGVSWFIRVTVIVVSVIVFSYIYQDVITLIGFEEEELINESVDLTRRIRGLSNAASGVDITQYNLPMKLFTFLFRPLFIDAPGLLGLIVSVENLFYLLIFIKIVRWDFITFIRDAESIVKTSLISFLGVSAALAQISANLGLAMRQKSQVMLLMLFVILMYLDDRKRNQLRQLVQRKKMMGRISIDRKEVGV